MGDLNHPLMTTPSKAIYYVGCFRHNLDAKNRLTIPSKWRFPGNKANNEADKEADNKVDNKADNEVDNEVDMYLASPHPEGYIVVFPPAEIERLYQKVQGIKMSDRDGQDFIARFFAESQDFECDKQGRINLNPELIKHAGIQKEAVLVGTMTRFAIWSPDRWKEAQGRASDEVFGELMKRIDF